MKTTTLVRFAKFWDSRKEAECILNLLRSVLPDDMTVGIEHNSCWCIWHVFYNKDGQKHYLMPEPSTPCGLCIPLGEFSSCNGYHNNVDIKF